MARIEQLEGLPFEFPVALDGIPGDPGLRAGQHAVLAEQGVNKRGLADIRPTDNGEPDGVRRLGIAPGHGPVGRFLDDVVNDFPVIIEITVIVMRAFGRIGRERIVKLAQPFAMLGGKRHRIAKTEPEGLVKARLACLALALVGNQNDLLLLAAKPAGEVIVQRRDTGTGIDHEQNGIRFGNGRLGLLPHPAFEAFVISVFQTRRIEQAEGQVTDPALTLATVAGNPRLVVDNSDALASEPVEYGRFADIRTADYGDCKTHGCSVVPRHASDQALLRHSRHAGAQPLCGSSASHPAKGLTVSLEIAVIGQEEHCPPGDDRRHENR